MANGPNSSPYTPASTCPTVLTLPACTKGQPVKSQPDCQASFMRCIRRHNNLCSPKGNKFHSNWPSCNRRLAKLPSNSLRPVPAAGGSCELGEEARPQCPVKHRVDLRKRLHSRARDGIAPPALPGAPGDGRRRRRGAARPPRLTPLGGAVPSAKGPATARCRHRQWPLRAGGGWEGGGVTVCVEQRRLVSAASAPPRPAGRGSGLACPKCVEQRF
jgi:hypothetical protein